MPEYLAPGVYVEEVSTGPKPIEGVGTSTTGMVGQTERGPTVPRLVTSWVDYTRWFGGYIDPTISYLPFAVKGFFDNGGRRVFIARVHGPGAGTASIQLPAASGNPLRLNAIGPGEWGTRLFVRIQDASKEDRDPSRPRFRLTILYFAEPLPGPFVDPLNPDLIADPNRREPSVVEDYDNVGIAPDGPSYVVSILNAGSQLVQIPDDLQPGRPTNIEFAPGRLTGGTPGGAIRAAEYNGTPVPNDNNERRGLAGLEVIDEVALLTVPDHVHPNVQNAAQIGNTLINQCERLKDRFAIINTPRGVVDLPFDTNFDSKYTAMYYPWIRIFDPRTSDNLLIPPSGHVAGVYARTDIERGVHKAPANEVLRGIINRDLDGSKKPLEFQISRDQQALLNPIGVNVIRDFRSDGRGIRVWGARTLSSDPEWKYVNVRRLFIFIEESIDEGTQWVVFEPNYEQTWAKVRRSITNFLISVWRSGGLQGVTQEEAFFVRCDRTTMTEDDINNGRLICLIGVAPVKPAEFVIFRIGQKTLEATS